MQDPAVDLPYYPYYCLYLAEERPDGQTNRETHPDGAHPQDDDDDDAEAATSAAGSWTPDTWTAAELAEAQALLTAHAAHCRVPVHRQRVLPSDAQAWDDFYGRHRTNFFKDRHWLEADFPHEFTIVPSEVTSRSATHSTTGGGDGALHTCSTTAMIHRRTLVEMGCGVGNALLPLLEDPSLSSSSEPSPPSSSPSPRIEWTVYGVDLSAVAIRLLHQDARFQQAQAQQRAWAAVADLAADGSGLPKPCRGVADVATLLFCLSAIPPSRHAVAAQNAVQALRRPSAGGGSGGVLVVRDYGRYDQAELQLGVQRGKRLVREDGTNGDGEKGPYNDRDSSRYQHYYVKHDHTKCYYFTTDDLRRLFVDQCGLVQLENRYIQRQYVNRATQTRRRRIWVQARFAWPENEEADTGSST